MKVLTKAVLTSYTFYSVFNATLHLQLTHNERMNQAAALKRPVTGMGTGLFWTSG
jgi:hypothetical protein